VHDLCDSYSDCQCFDFLQDLHDDPFGDNPPVYACGILPPSCGSTGFSLNSNPGGAYGERGGGCSCDSNAKGPVVPRQEYGMVYDIVHRCGSRWLKQRLMIRYRMVK
jgi:hypothetical protein